MSELRECERPAHVGEKQALPDSMRVTSQTGQSGSSGHATIEDSEAAMQAAQPSLERRKMGLRERINPVLRIDRWARSSPWRRLRAYYHTTSLRFRRVPARAVFNSIYRQNIWGGDESVSGKGSDLLRTATLIEELPRLLREIGAKTMIDAACGDFHWMKEVDLPVESYVGMDIIPELMEKNAERYGDSVRSFRYGDIMSDDLPTSDVIMCRDCLVHLSYADALRALKNFQRSGSTYLIATTFVARMKNSDIRTGGWRPLNLELPPFNLGQPLRVLSERCDEDNGAYRDKSLGLWKLDEIRV